MSQIHVYEPALCCNTGVCGPELDQTLVTFTADLEHVKGSGAQAERHNLANDPQAFAASETVRSFLQVAGSEGLPLTLVDGVTVLTGRYPSRSELLRWAGLALPMAGGCCSGGEGQASGCCDDAPEQASGCCGDSPKQTEDGCCGDSVREPQGRTELHLTAADADSEQGECCGGSGCCR